MQHQEAIRCGKILSKIVLGIIDEGLMLNKLCHEALDCSLKDLAPAEDKEKKWRQIDSCE